MRYRKEFVQKNCCYKMKNWEFTEYIVFLLNSQSHIDYNDIDQTIRFGGSVLDDEDDDTNLLDRLDLLLDTLPNQNINFYESDSY